MYRIMVIDDDTTSLSICKAMLGKEYKVILMKSGIQALGYLAKNPYPDLILLDMMMPGMNGMEVLQALKADPALCHIPVLFLTSMEGDRFIIDGYMAGAAGFVLKPVVVEILLLKLQRQLEYSRMRQENTQLREKLDKITRILQDKP